MDSFAPPNPVSQDLLLIQSLLGIVAPSKSPSQAVISSQDDIDSSSSEYGSEDEIEDVLMLPDSVNDTLIAEDGSAENIVKNERSSAPLTVPLDSESDLDESDDDSNSSSSAGHAHSRKTEEPEDSKELDEEGERGLGVQSQTYYTSQNEVVDGAVDIPDIEEIGPNEIMENVGEVMSILDKTVIIKGLPSSSLDRDQKALDAETLLVFDDRKVLGLNYETFGPTAQPMYQVKFSATYPIDTDKVRIGRPVFHVPARSNFIALRQLRHLRGSDASNVYDEEPGMHELEFSDDEAEADFKRNLKQTRRGQREGSVASGSSRYGTPARNMTDAFGINSAYDDPYMDASTCRPALISYDDDPYSDTFAAQTPVNSLHIDPSTTRTTSTSSTNTSQLPGTRRGHHRDRRGRGVGRGQRGRGDQSMPRPSPPAFPISVPPMVPPYHAPPQLAAHGFQNPDHAWQFQQSMIQPHINPRFFPLSYSMPYSPSQQHWNEGWNADAPDSGQGPPPRQ